MVVRTSSIYLALGVLGLFAGLMFSLLNFVSVYYGYMGFRPSAEVERYVPAALGLMLLYLAVNWISSPSTKLLLMIQLIVPVLGVYLLFSTGVASLHALALTTAGVTLVALLTNLAKFRYRVSAFRSEQVFVGTGITIVVLYVLALIATRGVGNVVLSLSDVYEYRSASGGSYALALMRSAAITFASLLFAYALTTRRRALQLFCIASFLLFFIYSGHKRFLFLIPFIYIAYIAIRSGRAYYIVMLYVAPLLLTAAAYVVLDSSTLLNFVARRSLLIPSLLVEYYVEYFGEHGAIWFAHSKLGQILGTYDPMLSSPAKLVGAEFFSEGANANGNWIASSYMNMGNLGIFIYGPIVAVLFALPGALMQRQNQQIFLIAAIVVYSSFMQNSDLVTSFLSNGVASYVLVWMLWGNVRISMPSKSPSAPPS